MPCDRRPLFAAAAPVALAFLVGCGPQAARPNRDALDAPLPTPVDACEYLGSTEIDFATPGLVIGVGDAPHLTRAVKCFPRTRNLRLILSGIDDLTPLAGFSELEWLTLDPHESPSACGSIQSLPTLRSVRHVIVQVACETVDFDRLLKRLPALESFRLVDRGGNPVVYARPDTVVPGNAGSERLRERALTAVRTRFPDSDAGSP